MKWFVLKNILKAYNFNMDIHGAHSIDKHFFRLVKQYFI